MNTRFALLLVGLVALAGATSAAAAEAARPAVREGALLLQDFKFDSGESLPELRLHYRTLGTPRRDAQGRVNNAVLLMHGTTGSGTQFLQPQFAGELFGPGQPLDVAKYFIVLRDAIGHGKSSKPSDGLRAKFPRYGYRDIVRADHLLLTRGLDVNHLKLVAGTSSGGMHTWLWGEMFPDFMDGLVPLGSLPVEVSGRNRVWRRMITDTIRSDPLWRGGNYTAPPPSLRLAAKVVFFVLGNPLLRQAQMPTAADADAVLAEYEENFLKTTDANNLLYAVESSHDYDPGPDLGKIRARLVAINSFDDLINPPELGILEREIRRVPHGRIYMIPYTAESQGHGSHTSAELWRDELARFLLELEPVAKP